MHFPACRYLIEGVLVGCVVLRVCVFVGFLLAPLPTDTEDLRAERRVASVLWFTERCCARTTKAAPEKQRVGEHTHGGVK